MIMKRKMRPSPKQAAARYADKANAAPQIQQNRYLNALRPRLSRQARRIFYRARRRLFDK